MSVTQTVSAESRFQKIVHAAFRVDLIPFHKVVSYLRVDWQGLQDIHRILGSLENRSVIVDILNFYKNSQVGRQRWFPCVSRDDDEVMPLSRLVVKVSSEGEVPQTGVHGEETPGRGTAGCTCESVPHNAVPTRIPICGVRGIQGYAQVQVLGH